MQDLCHDWAIGFPDDSAGESGGGVGGSQGWKETRDWGSNAEPGSQAGRRESEIVSGGSLPGEFNEQTEAFFNTDEKETSQMASNPHTDDIIELEICLGPRHFGILIFVGEGEGGMFRENSSETCILCRVKRITGPGWMHGRSARARWTGKTQSDRVKREVGGIRMGNTCKTMADSCQCMTKTTTIL